jgi:hypothetical protein
VVELSGTHHFLISNEILQQIDAFVSSLPKKTLTAGTDSGAIATR